MVSRTPIPDAVIESERTPSLLPIDWEAVARANQRIANDLAAEVTRLHDEIDRLKGGEYKVPLISRADWTHPLYALWIEMGLDDIAVLQEAWRAVFVRRQCLKCEGTLAEHIVDADALGGCFDCGLLYYVRDGHFGIDTIERAQERGPDA